MEPVYIVATPQDPTSWLLYRGDLIIQWNLCIVATPQDPTSWSLYRGGLIIQWNLYFAGLGQHFFWPPCVGEFGEVATIKIMHTGVADLEFSNQATSVQQPTGWVLRGGHYTQVSLYNQATSV